MTKQDTAVMKGVAIIFMVWLHCFNERVSHVLDYQDIIIGGSDLSFLLTRMTGPVELYILLSGYGLYCTFKNRNRLNPLRRLSKLYLLYWITLIVFVGSAYLLGRDGYPGGVTDILANVTGWNTTYNATIWFLFPYAVMVLIARFLFVSLDKKPVLSLIGAIGLYFCVYFVSWLCHHHYIDLGYAFKETIRVLNMICPFMIGASICKFELVERVKERFKGKQLILSILLIALVMVRLSTDFDFGLQLIYSSGLIIGISSLRKSKWITNTLAFFGKHSTTMWLTHAYFVWYLFAPYPYTLRYPILIFGVSLLSSLVAAIIIDWGYSRICAMIFERKDNDTLLPMNNV